MATYKQKTLQAENDQLISQNEKAELESRLIKSQNAYLQQQLNPHLLFNALNFIYSEVLQNSRSGAKVVELLTDILRYSLDYNDAEEKTTADLEILQIKNLVEINQYRYNTPLALAVEITGNFTSAQIIPLILLTLTENVFKHGNLRDPDHPATIKISLTENGELTFYTHNLKKAGADQQRLSSIGLKNIRTRLDYIYPNNYHLDVKETENYYQLNLSLKL